MADVTVQAHRVRTVDVRPYLDSEHGPFVVVDLVEESVRIHVGPEFLERARVIAGSIIAACNMVDARRTWVSIESLAPDAPPAA